MDSSLLDTIGNNMIWIVGGLIAITAIVFEGIKGIARTNARERSRREIAAYIAEGSMTPKEGEKLMRAVPDEDA